MQKQLKVACECGSDKKETISSLAQKIFEGAKNLEVLVNQNPLDLLNLLTASPFASAPCAGCEGSGFINVANGPDDSDREPCRKCTGSGRVIAAN